MVKMDFLGVNHNNRSQCCLMLFCKILLSNHDENVHLDSYSRSCGKTGFRRQSRYSSRAEFGYRLLIVSSRSKPGCKVNESVSPLDE